MRPSRQIALAADPRRACEADLPRGVVLMDAGYGSDTELRTDIGALGLSYVAGIMPNTSVWAPGHSTAAAEEMVGSRTTPEADRS